MVILETVENELKKLEDAALQVETCSNPSELPSLQPLFVIQSLKYVVNLMDDLCTLDIIQIADALEDTCKNFVPSNVSI